MREIVLMAVLILAAGGGRQPEALPPGDVEIIRTAVNATAIAKVLSFPAQKPPVLVTPDRTLSICGALRTAHCVPASATARLSGSKRKTDADLADAFALRNGKPARVTAIDRRIAVVAAPELDAVFERVTTASDLSTAWDDFRMAFGAAGIVRFSAPAVHGDRAAVYVALGCGGFCGTSWLVTLERRDGHFRVRDKWILTMV